MHCWWHVVRRVLQYSWQYKYMQLQCQNGDSMASPLVHGVYGGLWCKFELLQAWASSDICSIFCMMAETFCSASSFCCMVSATTLGGALSMNLLLLTRPMIPAKSFSSFSRCLFRRATSLLTSNKPAASPQNLTTSQQVQALCLTLQLANL